MNRDAGIKYYKKAIMGNVYGVVCLTISLFIFSFSGCGDPNTDVVTYYMDQAFKDYVLFPAGSYWVYENEALELDSVYCYSSNIEIQNGKTKLGYNYERLRILFTTSYLNATIYGDTHPEWSTQDFFVYQEVAASNPLAANVLFFNKNTVGYEYDNSEVNKVKYEQFMESYLLSGEEYKNVMIFENLINDGGPHRIYYAERVGIIRKELFNGQVWNLKRYHINN